jgi:hypothetical protein
MLLFYLIDPVGRTVKKIRDGFDRASELLGADQHALTTLWVRSNDQDSSVEMLVAEEAALDVPDIEAFFLYRFACGGKVSEWLFVGKGILAAGGDIPIETTKQLTDADMVRRAVDFLDGEAANVWLVRYADEMNRNKRVVHMIDHLGKTVDSSVRRRAVPKVKRSEEPARASPRRKA